MHASKSIVAEAHSAAQAASVWERYSEVRAHTMALAAPLSAEDCCVQSMPDASPTKWHLGHTSWFFETFVLERFEAGFKPFQPAFRILFNSYYNALGPKHPRPQRGLLTRPPLAEIYAYRRNIDQRMQRLLETVTDQDELYQLIVLGLNHEQQHQELILTDILHLLAQNPLHPVYAAEASATSALSAQTETTLSIAHYSWHEFGGGVVEIGHAGEDFCFDNETPRHSVYLQPYQLAAALVTNGEYLQFVEAGAYTRPGLWLSEGWDWVVANQRTHPLYWHKEGEHWQEFTLDGMVPLAGNAPLRHISYYEAEAYARWINARLPTEAEWEHAAVTHDLLQGQDTAWQWTQSSYAPYPGYQPATGAIGEYNGKFMVNQYVLRGGSSATPAGHTRTTYRNFFPAHACWQFSGIRLARDLLHPA